MKVFVSKIEASLVMKSGAVVRYFADRVTAHWDQRSQLLNVANINARHYPLHLDLDQVAAVTTRHVPIWASLPR